MKCIYTKHAEENIGKRELDKVIIEDVLKNPEKTIRGKFGCKIAQKTMNEKLLRVVYKEEENAFIIITAYYTKPERYL